jgi:hypothetical protein
MPERMSNIRASKSSSSVQWQVEELLLGPNHPGLPDGFFQTKNPNLGNFLRALDWKMLIYFMVMWNILQTFGLFYDHLVHFVFIWYILSGFGIMYQEKFDNPAPTHAQTSKVKRARLLLRTIWKGSPG